MGHITKSLASFCLSVCLSMLLLHAYVNNVIVVVVVVVVLLLLIIIITVCCLLSASV